LANWNEISDEIYSKTNWLDNRTGWKQHTDMVSLDEDEPKEGVSYLEFYNQNDFRTSIVEMDINNKTLLPISAWTKIGLKRRYYLNIPQLESAPLILSNHIRKTTGATIFLTDSIELAVKNNQFLGKESLASKIWTSWYGEKDAVNRVKWDDLKNHKVYYVITEHPGITVKEAYEIAYKVFEKIANLRGIELYFVEISQAEDEAKAPFNFVHLSVEDFLSRAQIVLGHKEDEDKYPFNPVTMKQLIDKPLEEREFILSPILFARSTTLLYAPTNVGKTWLALCMGYVISMGKTMFKENNWKARRARKVLYIDSEMDEKSLQDRVRIIANMQFNGRRYGGRINNNFFSITKKRSTQRNEEFQDDVVKFVKAKNISLLILDNLTAFTQHNDSAKAWEDIHNWLDRLKKKGCAVLLIHHTNKAGEQRGTSATTNAVDNVIRLKKRNVAGDKKNEYLGIEVHIEKGRDIYGTAKNTFNACIKPNAIPPACEFDDKQPPSKSTSTGFSKEKVFTMLKNGKSICEIAITLNCSVSRIYQIDGLRKTKEYKEMEKRRTQKMLSKHQQIMVLHDKGEQTKNIAEELNISITTVTRVIEETQKKEILSLKTTSLDKIMEKTGFKKEIIERIRKKEKKKRIPRLYDENTPVEDIAKKLRLPLEEVKREIRRFCKKLEKKRTRVNEINKIKTLHEEGGDRANIFESVDLPKRTVTIELNRLDRANTS
ncbi:MAG: AAA family ATPase, partial [Victivallaceae bacterium]|nr:AAA family ATPase [Victivallaceae bacterium]